MKLTFNQDLLFPIIAVALIIGIVSIDVIVCSPLSTKIKKEQKHIKIYRNETIELKKILESNKNRKLTIHLSDSSKIDEVTEQVQKIGQKNNVIFDFKELPEEDRESTAQSYKRMNVTIQTSGTYKNIGQFLSDLRMLDNVVIDLEQLVISSDLSDPAKILATLKIIFYFSK